MFGKRKSATDNFVISQGRAAGNIKRIKPKTSVTGKSKSEIAMKTRQSVKSPGMADGTERSFKKAPNVTKPPSTPARQSKGKVSGY